MSSPGAFERPLAPDKKVAWFHCFAGISGDMALGSLLDAGADLEEVTKLLERLPLQGWSLRTEAVRRNGLACTKAIVSVSGDGVARRLADIVAILDAAKLPPRVRARSLTTFELLAAAEGRVHSAAPKDVHFHELGGHDTIVDIVGTAAALEVLGVDEVRSSTISTGTGMITSAHGILPNPTPAVLELLRGAPVRGLALDAELVTPTGAALVMTLGASFGPLPPMRISATGYGAGSRELAELPNCAQVVLGTVIEAATERLGQPLSVIEANLDDATGEQLADTLQALLRAGALDAWITPIVMKKGRPGHLVSALGDLALLASLEKALVAESGTLGVRVHEVQRFAAPREIAQVVVEGHVVQVKVSPGRVKAEHDDAAAVAGELGISVREVAGMAEQTWRAEQALRISQP